MRRPLILHPAFQFAPAAAITVDITRPMPTRLALTFTLTGDTTALRIPPPAAPARTHELWKHSCFEAFLRPDGGEAYREFNLAPSGQWAVYRFDGYRQGMAPDMALQAPTITTHRAKDQLVVDAAIDLAGAPDLAGPLRLGASAVIETADGGLSYWAVAHPAGRPDFHHADGFAVALALAATGNP